MGLCEPGTDRIIIFLHKESLKSGTNAGILIFVRAYICLQKCVPANRERTFPSSILSRLTKKTKQFRYLSCFKACCLEFCFSLSSEWRTVLPRPLGGFLCESCSTKYNTGVLLEKCKQRNDTWSERCTIVIILLQMKPDTTKLCFQRFVTDKKSPDLDGGERGCLRDEGMFYCSGGKGNWMVEDLRYHQFMTAAAMSKTRIKPQSPAPTKKCNKYHFLRIRLQVIEWKTWMGVELSPLDWGWKLYNNSYEPIMTDFSAAPDNIPRLIRGKCNVSKKSPCSTNVCRYRQQGLSCVSASGSCNRVG
ncbi:unnamed protein product [Lepeophtheirus salmonis]|uniref:(salmon louse) hypothetical protein n=1 Tax=Lepeophtheirus salmonis TaxID=72036 RepID=A0A7R8CXY0_LEPSM|nr:unnamed protein product [Lepeophtheirus salmonis]CAF2936801.1 unnamed protein product [Lepeophtheirus salmonis]